MRNKLHTFIGVDPGLVNTGLVVMRINQGSRDIYVEHWAISDDPQYADHAEYASELLEELNYDISDMWIESYRERGTQFGTNPRMRELMTAFNRAFPGAKILDNTGVKKVVTSAILKALGLNEFPTTHHQDLQSAARIMVYGMLKNEEYNNLIFHILGDYIAGYPWPVMK